MALGEVDPGQAQVELAPRNVTASVLVGGSSASSSSNRSTTRCSSVAGGWRLEHGHARRPHLTRRVDRVSYAAGRRVGAARSGAGAWSRSSGAASSDRRCRLVEPTDAQLSGAELAGAPAARRRGRQRSRRPSTQRRRGQVAALPVGRLAGWSSMRATIASAGDGREVGVVPGGVRAPLTRRNSAGSRRASSSAAAVERVDERPGRSTLSRSRKWPGMPTPASGTPSAGRPRWPAPTSVIGMPSRRSSTWSRNELRGS